MSKKSDYVAIHDGARPWIRPSQIEKVFETAMQYGAAVSARPITDTVKRCDQEGAIKESISRKDLWAMETPQIFRTELIERAYNQAAAIELVGAPVRVVHDPFNNPKITFPDDLKAQDPMEST